MTDSWKIEKMGISVDKDILPPPKKRKKDTTHKQKWNGEKGGASQMFTLIPNFLFLIMETR